MYQYTMRHPHTSRSAKWLLALALGYLAMPFDFKPVLGVIDDALIVPRLIYLALKQIPDEVIEECRQEVADH